MPVPPGKVPIIESAGAGFRFLTANIVPAAALAAAVAAPIAALETVAQGALFSGDILTGWSLWLLSLLTGTAFHAPLLARALSTGAAPPALAASAPDALRLAGAMSVTGFFYLIAAIPALFVLGAGFGVIAAPWADRIQANQGDATATLQILQELVQQRPGEVLLLLMLAGFGWLALTSRLYLVAPATIADKRMRTFETWAWTRGNMVRIMFARLTLLVPLFAATVIIQRVIVVGFGGEEALSQGGSAVTFAVRYLSTLFFLMMYGAAEVGLSAYLHRGLRPATQP